MKALFTLVVALLTIAVATTGCSQLLGGLRPDLNDGQSSSYEAPTVGGRWSERGMLDDNSDGYTVGHNERAPASGRTLASNNNDWNDPDRAAQSARDSDRNPNGGDGSDGGDAQTPSYSNTPNMPPPVRRQYKNGSRATSADFIDESTNEGSLWASDGQTNYYFTKNKVRGVGDIVTVSIEDAFIRDLGTEVRRTLTDSEKEQELALAELRAQARANGGKSGKSDAVPTSQAAPADPSQPASAGGSGAPGDAIQAAPVTPADIDVSKSLEVKAGDPIMAEIVERYPNGNYKIRGSKRIMYRNGSPRLVNMTAVVKGSDISDDDQVSSGKLYEYRLEAIR